MSMSDQTAIVLIIAICVIPITVCLFILEFYNEEPIKFDSMIYKISKNQVQVLHPNGEYVWVYKNNYRINLGESVLVEYKESKGHILGLVEG